MGKLRQIKHPYLFLTATIIFIASGIGWAVTGADTSYLVEMNIPGESPTELITNIFLENPVIGLLTFAALAIGVLQYSGEGYNKIDLSK